MCERSLANFASKIGRSDAQSRNADAMRLYRAENLERTEISRGSENLKTQEKALKGVALKVLAAVADLLDRKVDAFRSLPTKPRIRAYSSCERTRQA